MLTRDKEGKDRIRLIRCAHASEVTPLPMWKPDDGVKYTFGNVLRKSTDGKSRVFVGTRVDEEEDDEKHKIVAKLVLKGDNMAISAFREARVWSLLQRYSPFFRLHPPIELLPPNRLVFPRLSLSLAQIREEHGPFGIETTLRLGLEMLAAIRELHDYAFVHRNVTPNHFLLHPSNSPSRLFRGLVLIDLAQASPYVSFNPLHGAVPDTVAHPNLVFASPHFNTDELHVMGRRDDLFSWFIIMLYLHLPQLPWAKTAEAEIQKQKQTATTSSINQTCKLFGPVCGDLMAQVAGHLNGLQVEQMPRYARFYRQFVRSLEHVGGNGQLSSYSDNVRVASENIFGPLKAAIVHPPRFTYWAQHNKHDVDYGKISAEFRASYDETVDNREFTLLEAKANVNRFEYAERHLKVEKRAAMSKIPKSEIKSLDSKPDISVSEKDNGTPIITPTTTPTASSTPTPNSGRYSPDSKQREEKTIEGSSDEHPPAFQNKNAKPKAMKKGTGVDELFKQSSTPDKQVNAKKANSNRSVYVAQL